MFSLIITIISIVLVGLLAVATIYYGGDAFSQRGPEAQAGTILNNGQQISGAMEVRHADGRGALVSVANLAVESNGQTYLNSVPVPPKGAYVSGEPTAADWVLLNPGSSRSSYMLEKKVSQEVCHWINFKAYGDGDIREAVDSRKLIQCFGTAAPFTVLFGSGAANSTNAPNITDDIAVFNTSNVDPTREITVAPDGGLVTFNDVGGLRKVSTSGSNVTPPSGGASGNSGTPASGGTAGNPNFTPSGTIVTAYNPTTKALSLALPLTNNDFTTSATYQAVTGITSTPSGNEITSFSMVNFVQARTPITNSTNAYLKLGTLPSVLSDQSAFGSYTNYPVVFSGDNALSLINSIVAQSHAINAMYYTNPTQGSNGAASDYIGLCNSGQLLAPGQSCDMGFIGSADAAVLVQLSNALPGLAPPPTGYLIPFTWGDTAANVSPSNSGVITVGTP